MWYCFQRGIVDVESWRGSLHRAWLVDYLCLLDIDLKTDSSVSGSYHIEGMLKGLGGVSNQHAIVSVLEFSDLEGSSLGGFHPSGN